MLTANCIIEIQKILEQNDAGFRKLPGTSIMNQTTGKTVYVPPQDPREIIELMNNLESYINNKELSDIDPLIKMAVIHWQFESIHPFYDGNGRTGRIINILYMVINDLLNLPILYLSRFIIRNKSEYYRLLQDVRDNGSWEEWIIYMVRGVEETSIETIELIKQIRELMIDYKRRIRDGGDKELKSVYSQDLLNNLFKHPYTKIEYVMNDLRINRHTAQRRLDILIDHGFLVKQKKKNTYYYINTELYSLFKKDVSKDNAPLIITLNPPD
ncbi:MAG TPA: Fic family protein [Ignavibacteriales bacterium]|nr:Fic family protein [Ignavibacteriales bacterium]